MARAAAIAIRACLAVIAKNTEAPRISVATLWSKFTEKAPKKHHVAPTSKIHVAGSSMKYVTTTGEFLYVQQGPAPVVPGENTFYTVNAPNDDFEGMLFVTVIFLASAYLISPVTPRELREKLAKKPRRLKPMSRNPEGQDDIEGIVNILHTVLIPATGLASPTDKTDIDTDRGGLLLHVPPAHGTGSLEPYPPPSEPVDIALLEAHRAPQDGVLDLPLDEEEEEEDSDTSAEGPIVLDESVLRELENDEWGEF